MLRLRCTSQLYEWGKIGIESEVFQLCSFSHGGSKLDPSKPYAELWMGTHPSGPSLINDPQATPLSTYIENNPNCLGFQVMENFGNELPFLLKVLSINKPLSIQAHPGKELATELHQENPEIYKDANAKPEMAIALTPFEALMAFRPIVEISALVQNIPELLELVGPECAAELEGETTEKTAPTAIKNAFGQLMSTDAEKISAAVEKLKNRLSTGEVISLPSPPLQTDLKQLGELFVRLANQFPGDIGCFCLFFLNYVKLEPGEAVFLETQLPHAYLSGDCIECMACSDNVVRAGLTPKPRDVDCLLKMLQYEPRIPESLKFTGIQREVANQDPDIPQDQQASIVCFDAGIKDFIVDKITMGPSCYILELVPLRSASILIVINGKGRLQKLHLRNHIDKATDEGVDSNEPIAGCLGELLEFHRGSIFFIEAGASICILQHHTHTNKTTQDLVMYRAYANV